MFIYFQVICLGVLIACGVALNRIDDLFSDDIDDDSQAGQDRDQYRGVAGWLLFVAIGGIIVQGVMFIFRLLYYVEVITSQFIIFGVVVSYIFKVAQNYFCVASTTAINCAAASQLLTIN